MESFRIRRIAKEALAAALEAAGGVAENGGCNVHSIFVPTGRREVLMRRTEPRSEAFGAAGWTVRHGSTQDGRDGYFLSAELGEGPRRTVALAAAVAILAPLGAMACGGQG